MTQPVQTNNDHAKLSILIEKFGGWAIVAIISMLVWFYNTGQQENIRRYEQVTVKVQENTRAIGKLQDSKASRAELKELQESFLRETQGLRQDFKEGFSILRSDIAVRREYQNPPQK